MPEKIEGVKVRKAVAALHFLQGTGGTGDNNNISDGDKIGEYIVHYDDRTTATIPIVFGEDLRDWWNWDNSKKVTRGKVAWEGANERCKLSGLKLRLYVTTWDNPSPSKTITHLDFVTDKKTTCAPFCVAITGEENNVEKGPQ